jgi:Ca-activated chloride channel homolog
MKSLPASPRRSRLLLTGISMRIVAASRTSTLLVACALAVLCNSGAPAQQQPPFRSGTRTVAVYATVTDSEGRLVPDLTQEDFEVYDNGKLQPLTLFSSELQPITVAMLLDRSGSMRQNFRLIEEAGKAFVRRLRPGDKARIGSFAARIQLDPEDFTSDHEQMFRILSTELQHEGPTPLWNAVNVGITSLLKEEGRRVVLVFTDGRDNPMNFKFNNLSVMDVMRRAQEENVIVYAIGLASFEPTAGGGGFGRRGGFGGGFGGGGMMQGPDPGLPTIAGETGGGYFELSRADALAPTFARVADELHRQYALGFSPAKLDGKTHKLEIKVKKQGMKARARKSYLAARE